MAIFPQEKKLVYALGSNCFDGWMVTQMITFQPVNVDTREYPWGIPLKDVGKFNLCTRRYSCTHTTDCKSCRRETMDWSRQIVGDIMYSNMVGSFSKFINKKLSIPSADFTIRSEDIEIKNIGDN